MRRRWADGSEGEVNLSFVDFAGVSRPRPAAAGGRGKRRRRRPRLRAARGGTGGGGAKPADDPVLRGLSRVVDSLHSGLSHVPYRDSKLTRLLAHAFGAGGIALVHARADRFEEAEAALAFGRQLAELPAAAARQDVAATRGARGGGGGRWRVSEKLARKREAVAGAASVRLDDKSTDDELKLHDAAALLERLDLRLGAWRRCATDRPRARR